MEYGRKPMGGAAGRAGFLVVEVDAGDPGRTPDELDIAPGDATAPEHALVLVTRNTRHFEPVPRLAVENRFSGP